MDRINKILYNQQFREYLLLNAKAEIDREFCHHDLHHLLDVARVAYILALEEKLGLSKDLIYATALLHDAGRWQEYSQGKDHAETSAELAVDILEKCGYCLEEIQKICAAIKDHRKGEHQEIDLNRILYRSDKISRPCIECPVIGKCKRFKENEEPILYY